MIERIVSVGLSVAIVVAMFVAGMAYQRAHDERLPQIIIHRYDCRLNA